MPKAATTVKRWRYAVFQRFPGGQRFLGDYDTRHRPRVGRLIAFKKAGVLQVESREDGKGFGDLSHDIGTLYVKAPGKDDDE